MTQKKNLNLTALSSLVGLAILLPVMVSNFSDRPESTPTSSPAVSASASPVATPVAEPVETQAPAISEISAGSSDLLDSIATLRVSDIETTEQYRRDTFGEPWKDVTGNGCDTRNDVLLRDLENVSFSDDKLCKVETGVLNDPYTGLVVNFQRGQKTSAEVPVDHIYPLAEAFRVSAHDWTEQERLEFANDPVNLVATTQSINSWKSDKTPAEMFNCLNGSDCEPSTAFIGGCFYAERFVTVALKYDLPVSSEDVNALNHFAKQCFAG